MSLYGDLIGLSKASLAQKRCEAKSSGYDITIAVNNALTSGDYVKNVVAQREAAVEKKATVAKSATHVAKAAQRKADAILYADIKSAYRKDKAIPADKPVSAKDLKSWADEASKFFEETP